MRQDFKQQQQRLAELVQSLDYLSPLKIMGRGYSYVTSKQKVVADVNQLHAGDQVVMHLTNGQANATIKSIQPDKKDGQS